MTDSSRIREKVRALLKLASDKGATEAEASSALALASAIMAKYNIEAPSEDVEDETRRGEWAWRKGLKQWHVFLAEAAGHLYTCRLVVCAGTLGFQWVGRPENIAAAELTYDWLVDQVERLYKLALPSGLSKTDRAEYRRTFKTACSLRVRARAWEILKALANNDRLAIEMTGSRALVVKEKHKQLFDEADSLLRDDPTLKDLAIRSPSIGLGTAHGLQAAEHVKLNEVVKAPTQLALTHQA